MSEEHEFISLARAENRSRPENNERSNPALMASDLGQKANVLAFCRHERSVVHEIGNAFASFVC